MRPDTPPCSRVPRSDRPHRRGALCLWAADRDGEESGTAALWFALAMPSQRILSSSAGHTSINSSLRPCRGPYELVGRAVESIAVYRPGGRSWLLRGRAGVKRKSGYLRMSCRMAISACTVPSSRGALSVPIEPCASASDGTSCTPLVSHGCDGATPPDLSGG